MKSNTFTLAEGTVHTALSNSLSKSAFTLAEVLITLGIIGIVAALTMPSLVADKRAKELETALKKNASIIQQAVLMITYEDGIEPTPLNLQSSELKTKIKPHLNVLKDCGRGTTDLAACVTNTAYIPDAKNTYKNYTKSNNISYNYLDDGQLLLTDGALLMFENSNPDFKQVFITVDVNGYLKPPNAWGHDLFTFDLTEKGKVLPMGAEGTKFANDAVYCSKTSNNSLNGIGCTYKALSEPDYFKNLPK